MDREPALSRIPEDRELIVIDIGDSRLAPHQAAFPADERRYYYREGGRSVPAPHHYLEALRNRLVAAVLDVTLEAVCIRRSHRLGDIDAALEVALGFRVANTSKVACYKWTIDCRVTGHEGCLIGDDRLPALGRRDGLRLDDTILPTRTKRETVCFGIKIGLFQPLERQVASIIPSVEVQYRAISENHIGELKTTPLSTLMDARFFTDKAKESLRAAEIDFSWGVG